MNSRPKRKILADDELPKDANAEQALYFALISDIGYIDYESKLGADACVFAARRSILRAIKDETT